MTQRLRQFIVWLTLAQVGLVGGIGTGLHTVFGCEHAICGSSCCAAASDSLGECQAKCAFCRKSASPATASPATAGDSRSGNAQVVSAAAVCDGCLVCDLLVQYHNATPLEIGLPSIELAAGEACLERQNGVVAAACRLAHSRGPPSA